MRAITIQQPWAHAILYLGKNIENRTQLGMWRAAAGETIAIHASTRWSERGCYEIPRILQSDEPIGIDVMTRGSLLGLVDVTDVHREQDGCCQPWGERSYTAPGFTPRRVDVIHLVLTNPRPLPEPILMRGMLGLWRLPDHIEPHLLEQARIAAPLPVML